MLIWPLNHFIRYNPLTQWMNSLVLAFCTLHGSKSPAQKAHQGNAAPLRSCSGYNQGATWHCRKYAWPRNLKTHLCTNQGGSSSWRNSKLLLSCSNMCEGKCWGHWQRSVNYCSLKCGNLHPNLPNRFYLTVKQMSPSFKNALTKNTAACLLERAFVYWYMENLLQLPILSWVNVTTSSQQKAISKCHH